MIRTFCDVCSIETDRMESERLCQVKTSLGSLRFNIETGIRKNSDSKTRWGNGHFCERCIIRAVVSEFPEEVRLALEDLKGV